MKDFENARTHDGSGMAWEALGWSGMVWEALGGSGRFWEALGG
jgi:hypothetical protein